MANITFDMSQMVDVARFKPTRASSQFSPNWAPGDAVRPDLDRLFGFHTADGDSHPSWEVDLLVAYPLQQIVIHDRPGFNHRSKTLRVEVSLDGFGYETVHAGRVYSRKDEPLVFPLAGQVQARFVRLSLDEPEMFHLKSVGVYVATGDLARSENGRLTPRRARPEAALSRIGILGTSNSILGGYVEGLRETATIAANLSVGSSHPSVIPYRLTALESINDLDYVILDVFTNELRALVENHQSLRAETRKILAYAKAWCARNSVVPVVLIMPARVESASLHSFYVEACREFQIPCFDGFAFHRDFSEVLGRDPRHNCLDLLHVSRVVAGRLGYALGQTLDIWSRQRALRPEAPTPDKDEVIIEASEHFFVALPNDAERSVTRQNSLVKERLTKIVPGDRVSIPVPDGCDLVGLVLNMAKSNGILRISSGESVRRKHLDSSFSTPDDGFWLVAWNLLGAMPLGRSVDLSVDPVTNCTHADCEPNDHGFDKSPHIREHPLGVEIAGMVLRSRTSELVRVSTLEELDLYPLLPQDFLRGLFLNA